MSDTTGELNHPILNLTEQEKRAFGYLFNQADSDQLGVVTGERAVAFFERTHVSPNVLGEIWQIADTENRGLLTRPGFCMVLRLIGHYQAGREPSAELAFKPAPVPKFDGLQIPGVGPAPPPQPAVPSPTVGGFPANALQPQLSGQGPIRVPPLDPQKVQQYSGLFDRSGAQNGMLDGMTAKSIFERAGLPNEALGKIWNLSDREQRGALDQTEFIVAMHLLTSMKTRTMSALPNTLPQGLYEAAARRGVPGPSPSRQSTMPQAIPRQFTGSSAGAPARTQSPLARPPGYSEPPTQSAQTTGTPWLITQQEKAKYDQFFATIDTQGRGVITGEQAVRFFSDSRLPEDTLATIWDLADINSEGQLNKDQFAVAMYLIRQQRSPNPAPLPAFLPPALIPPSMRAQQQSTQSTAPAFDNAANTSNLPKSATEDLFGLDEPSPPQSQQPQTAPAFQPLQAQTTGMSATRDPFGGSIPASPSSPQRSQTLPQQPVAGASSVFKPFMPTSAFGASLAQQHTGGSATSSQGQTRGFPQQQQAPTSHLQQASAMDDLLGDNDAHAEESSKLTNETTELANMSSQIGNLRGQMEQTQTKKTSTQADLTATNNQKRDLELRLQQFRSQYETEVRTVKELETQLTASRESTKKLGQDLAMLEGTYQDLQTQHSTVAQALAADQAENANLKQKIASVNKEVEGLKPAIEKLRLEARQQKGLVSINRKQLATNEGEQARLTGEKGDLEREAAEREEQARNAPQEPQQQPQSHFGRDAAVGAGVGAAAFGGYEAMQNRGVASPGAGSNLASPSGLSSTNPFFRKASAEGAAERATSPPATTSTGGPTPSAFDALFGPSAAFSPTGQAGSRTGTPPTTSFIGRSIPVPEPVQASQPQPIQPAQEQAHAAPQGMTDSIQSVSSVGEPTPSATPPLSVGTGGGAKESPQTAEPPPPVPENRQFTPGQLPLGGLPFRSREAEEGDADSMAAMPPASRAGGAETPMERGVPGAFGEERDAPGAFDGGEQTESKPAPESVPLPKENEPPSTSQRDVPEEKSAAPAEQQEQQGLFGRVAAIGAGVGAVAFGGFEAVKERLTDHQPKDDTDSTLPAAESKDEVEAAPQATQPKDDFDSAFAGFGESEQTKDAPAHEEDPFAPSSGQQQGQGYSSEFPPIRSLEPEDEESSDEEGGKGGFDDEFYAASPVRGHAAQHGAAEPTPAVASALPSYLAPEANSGEPNIAGARPAVRSIASTASSLPGISSQQSPPTYEQSNEPSHGGTGERSSSNQFPPEFGGLLPSREVPTSPPPPAVEPQAEQAVVNERPTTGNGDGSGTDSWQTPQTTGAGEGLFTSVHTPSTTDVFHDTNSRPISNVTDLTPDRGAQQASGAAEGQSKNAFDDFDDFDDLSEAKEADKGISDLDFGFGHPAAVDEFNPAFDSPATSMTNTMASSSHQQTPVPSTRQLESTNGFSNFAPHASSSSPFGESSGGAAPHVDGGSGGASSIQHTPQNMGHDWDAIFSGLDNSKGVDTSLGSAAGVSHDDPWGSPAANTSAFATNGAAERTPTAASSPVSERTTRASAPTQKPPTGRALTPGTEHDDPFLKRLTGMGYPRAEALNALEMYDYDINKAVDHLTGH